jgi:hypothetical protein
MICPQCKGEYREGFTFCSTCQVPLVPSPENLEEDGRPVRLIPLLIAAILGACLYIGGALLGKVSFPWYAPIVILVMLGVFAFLVWRFHLE